MIFNYFVSYAIYNNGVFVGYGDCEAEFRKPFGDISEIISLSRSIELHHCFGKVILLSFKLIKFRFFGKARQYGDNIKPCSTTE